MHLTLHYNQYFLTSCFDALQPVRSAAVPSVLLLLRRYRQNKYRRYDHDKSQKVYGRK